MTTDITTTTTDLADDGTQLFERLARDPNVSVERLEGMMALYERTMAKRSEAAFNSAMAKAQRGMRPVAADASNPHTNSKYASYAALDTALRPVYTEHGFGVSFDTGEVAAPDWIRVLAYVTHEGGHSRTYHVDIPADGKGIKGNDMMTKTHAVGSANTYGMRYLLKMIFNIAVGEVDDDGNGAGAKEVTPTPDGFEAWVTSLEAEVPKGTAALMKAFSSGQSDYRTALAVRRKASWESLKTRAADATKAQGAKR